jgi:uncharacterized protein
MRALLPSLVILSLLFGIQWYAFQAVITVINALTFPEYSLVYIFWWLTTGGISLTALLGFVHSRHTGKLTSTGRWLANAFATLLVGSVTLGLVVFLEDVYRLTAMSLTYLSQLSEGLQWPARTPWVSAVGLFLALALVVAMIDGAIWGKYRYKVHKITLRFPNLPQAFDGFRIVQISDIHAGSFSHKEGVEKGIKLVQQQNADLFVFTGDLVNNVATEIDPWISHFSKIKAPLGQFSVLGNHDYGDYISWPDNASKKANLEHLKDQHNKLGYRLLLDEAVRIEKKGQTIYLAGVENWGLGFGKRGNLAKALIDVPRDAFKILLSHDPSHWEAQVNSYPISVELTLSGHTHGMQFGLELFGWKWSPVQWRYPHWAGLKEGHGKYLYINRGFGFIGFNGRVGIYPEITVIELLKEEEK